MSIFAAIGSAGLSFDTASVLADLLFRKFDFSRADDAALQREARQEFMSVRESIYKRLMGSRSRERIRELDAPVKSYLSSKDSLPVVLERLMVFISDADTFATLGREVTHFLLGVVHHTDLASSRPLSVGELPPQTWAYDNACAARVVAAIFCAILYPATVQSAILEQIAQAEWRQQQSAAGTARLPDTAVNRWWDGHASDTGEAGAISPGLIRPRISAMEVLSTLVREGPWMESNFLANGASSRGVLRNYEGMQPWDTLDSVLNSCTPAYIRFLCTVDSPAVLAASRSFIDKLQESVEAVSDDAAVSDSPGEEYFINTDNWHGATLQTRFVHRQHTNSC